MKKFEEKKIEYEKRTIECYEWAKYPKKES